MGSEHPLQTARALRNRDARDEDVKGRLVRADPSELLERARRIALPVRLVAPDQVAATWLHAPDGALVLGLSNDPSWLLDPASKRPPVVRDAHLRIEPGAQGGRSIRTIRAWPGGADHSPAPPPCELLLPAFQDALVLRIEPSP